MARSAPRLVKRNGIFYFRMAVPRQLTQRLGRKEIKTSLRTADARAAKLLASRIGATVDALFVDLTNMPNVAASDIIELLQGYFKQVLGQSIEHAMILPKDSLSDLDAEIAYLDSRMAELRHQLAHRNFTPALQSDAHALLATINPEKHSVASERLQQACEGLLRANLENARILAAMLSGKYSETAPRDPLFIGITAEAPPIDGSDVPASAADTFGALSHKFQQHKSKHDWVAKTAADVRRAMKLAEAIIGDTKPIRKLSVDDVKAVRDALASIPPNYMKKAGQEDISPKEAIAQNQGEASLSLKTQEKYFSMFRQFLIWARQEEFIDKVPGEAIKIAGAAKIGTMGGRKPYSADQLKAIFGSPLFSGHRSEKSRHKPGSMLIRDGKFWVPLIALHSGMRMGEIVQLLVSDIKEQDGITYFDIMKGEDKTVKTHSSVRKVPVHKVLIDLGLLQQIKGAGRLFPDIEKGKDGYYSHNFSKWWGRYARQIGVSTSDTAFHSFRHNFKDALQAVEAPEYVAKALMGHSAKDVHAGYGTGPTLSLLRKYLDRIDYQLPGFPA